MPTPPAGFLDLPPELSDPRTARIVVLPVPYDGTSTWRKGADAGPAALIEASAAVEWYDIETASEVCRSGIATAAPIEWDGPPEGLADQVDAAVDAVWAAGRFPLLLGGEHSITIGAVRAAARRFPGLGVLQLDAHADTRESYHGSTHNHACVMARARELAPVVACGIRSIDAEELPGLDPERTFYAHRIAGRRDWIEDVVARLADPLYVTIDLDVFDPAVLPATGTPEPGGLSWYEVTDLLDAVARARRVVGFDVVELCPVPGQHASAFTAAKLAYRFLSIIFAYDIPT